VHETETLLEDVVPSDNGLAAAGDLDPAALAYLKPGEVNVRGPYAVPGLKPRHLRIYLPRAFSPDEPRHALLMFDGQNVFDDAPSHAGGWHLHEAVEKLARARPPRPAPIVVGIDHGGEERIAELSPFPHGAWAGRLEVLVDWVVGTVVPTLASALRLHPPPLGLAIGGSSMGGLAALWAHFHHPEFFGGALAMSPALWLARRAIFDDLARRPTPPVSRIYLDAGAREGRGILVPEVAALAAHLRARGYDEDHLMFRPDPRGAHNEASWRRRLPKALRFMYR
jgi:enterochelin esterase-like enzyme